MQEQPASQLWLEPCGLWRHQSPRIRHRKSSAMDVGYIENATFMSVCTLRSSSPSPRMPPTKSILLSVFGSIIPKMGSNRSFAKAIHPVPLRHPHFLFPLLQKDCTIHSPDTCQTCLSPWVCKDSVPFLHCEILFNTGQKSCCIHSVQILHYTIIIQDP